MGTYSEREVFKAKKICRHYEFTDITVYLLQDKTGRVSKPLGFKTHKILLAEASPVWKGLMLLNDKNPNVLILSELNYEVFQEIINFIHDGEIVSDTLKIILKPLLNAARKVEFMNLKLIS